MTDEYSETRGPSPVPDGSPSPVEGGVTAEQVQSDLKSWETYAADWLEDAYSHYDVIAGHQWDPETKSSLEEEDERPAVTFNRIAPLIRGICGLEIGNRQSVRYVPREVSDSATAEIMNSGAQWVRDECDAETEESDAFRDVLICGLGYTDTRVDTEVDPAGKIWIERCDPLMVAYDPNSVKRGLVDKRWIARWKLLPMSTIKSLWPERVGDIEGYVNSGRKYDVGANADQHDESRSPWYGSGHMQRQQSNGHLRVVQYQYFIAREGVRVMGRFPGQWSDMPQAQFGRLKEAIERAGLRTKKVKIREYRQAFVVGNVLLEDEKLPEPAFTINAMTGFRDRNKNTWYGLVRDLLDPQAWINKLYSLLLDILSTEAKGGILAEEDAFKDARQAEEDWSNPRKIIWLQRGGLQKIQPRASGGLPAAVQPLLTMAMEVFPHVSGVSLEFLGMVQRAQPGVLEYQRRQSTINTLAEFFAALSQYRRNQGRLLMRYIVRFLADGRLIRVVGKEGEAYLPLAFANNAAEFDVVVDEAPTSPDVKGRTWAVLEQVLPAMMKMGLPVPPDVFDYSPLPTALASSWKEQISQTQSGPKIPPELEKELVALREENQQLRQDRDVELARLAGELSVERARGAGEFATRIAELGAEDRFRRAQGVSDFAARMAEMGAENQLRHGQLRSEYELEKDRLAMESEAGGMRLGFENERAIQEANLKAAERRRASIEAARLQREKNMRDWVDLLHTLDADSAERARQESKDDSDNG